MDQEVVVESSHFGGGCGDGPVIEELTVRMEAAWGVFKIWCPSCSVLLMAHLHCWRYGPIRL